MLQWWGQWVKNRKIVLVIYSCNGKLSSSIGWNYYISFNIISYVNQVHVMDNLPKGSVIWATHSTALSLSLFIGKLVIIGPMRQG